MLTSLFTAVSGVKSEQSSLDAVSNNISNVSTTGYKRERANFADLLYTSYISKGNVSDLGHGVYVTNFQNIFTQGSFKTTNNNTDLAINGNGFFIVRDPKINNVNNYIDKLRFTRAGEFTINSDGKLVTPNGQILQGVKRDENGNFGSATTANLTDVVIKDFEVIPARQTSAGSMSFNLNANTPLSTVRTTTITPSFRLRQANSTFSDLANVHIYDTKGKSYTLGSILNTVDDAKVIYKQTEADTHISLKMKLDADNGANSDYIPIPVFDGNDNQYFIRLENYDNTNKQWDVSLYYFDGTNYNNVATQTDAVQFDDSGNLVSGTISFTGIDLNGDGTANETIKIDPTGSYAENGLANISTVLANELSKAIWKVDIGKDPTDSTNTTYKEVTFDGNGTVVSVKDSAGNDSELKFNLSVNQDINGDGDNTNDKITVDLTNTIFNTQLPKDLVSLKKDGFDPKNANSYGFSTAMTVYDSLGNAHTVDFYFIKTDKDDDLNNGVGTFNYWKWVAFVDGNTDYSVASGGILFNENGQLEKLYDENGNEVLDSNGHPTFKFTLNIPPSLLTNGMPPNTPPDPNNAPVSPIVMDLSFAGSTQSSNSSQIYEAYQNGYSSGQLTDININKDGVLEGIYDNGKTIGLYKIPLANMPDDSLKRVSDNLWMFAPTVPEGTDPYQLVKIAYANNSGLGTILDGTLEMSNVDITQEFVDMILAQRAFQANTKIINVDDEILQTVINLKR